MTTQAKHENPDRTIVVTTLDEPRTRFRVDVHLYNRGIVISRVYLNRFPRILCDRLTREGYTWNVEIN